MARIFSDVSPDEVAALKEILSRIVGTPIEPTGDIVFNLGGETLVIETHVGPQGAVVVKRD